MEIKYNYNTETYQLIYNGMIICSSEKGQITSDEQAKIWFDKVILNWLDALDSKGIILQ